MKSTPVDYVCQGTKGSLPIKGGDTVGRKLAMLFEGTCLGVQHEDAAQRYGYSRQWYYQVLASFLERGSEGLVEQKRGPQRRSVRTRAVVHQIIRHRFLDPNASAGVITQKLRQSGCRVSKRSVERTITEYGLQKKTPFIQAGNGGAGA